MGSRRSHLLLPLPASITTYDNSNNSRNCRMQRMHDFNYAIAVAAAAAPFEFGLKLNTFLPAGKAETKNQ